MPPQKPKRDRGVILTLHGWDKLQAVKSEAEFQENAGDRFTLEELSERTGLSLRTISKVLGRLEPVDKYSLQTFFQSFGLELSKSDYTIQRDDLIGAIATNGGWPSVARRFGLADPRLGASPEKLS